MAQTDINWFQIIAGLEKAGMSPAQIGKEIGSCRTTILYYKNHDGEPPWSKGEKLLDLYRTVTKSE